MNYRTAIHAWIRGVRFRLVTEIKKRNITFSKEIIKVAKIRHLEGIWGNFGVGDREYISTSNTISTIDIAISGIEEMTEGAKTVTTL